MLIFFMNNKKKKKKQIKFSIQKKICFVLWEYINIFTLSH
jgi:hypothetical protein